MFIKSVMMLEENFPSLAQRLHLDVFRGVRTHHKSAFLLSMICLDRSWQVKQSSVWKSHRND